MRKAPNEEKIEEAQDCDFAGKFHHFAVIAFVAAIRSHILSETSRKESEILGLFLLLYVPNWQEITVNWSELAHSNGLVSTQVVVG